jgi:hypothetical protein
LGSQVWQIWGSRIGSVAIAVWHISPCRVSTCPIGNWLPVGHHLQLYHPWRCRNRGD